jgi:hypothetical protein
MHTHKKVHREHLRSPSSIFEQYYPWTEPQLTSGEAEFVAQEFFEQPAAPTHSPPSNAHQLISYWHILIIHLSKVSAIDRNIYLYRPGLKEYHYSK